MCGSLDFGVEKVTLVQMKRGGFTRSKGLTPLANHTAQKYTQRSGAWNTFDFCCRIFLRGSPRRPYGLLMMVSFAAGLLGFTHSSS